MVYNKYSMYFMQEWNIFHYESLSKHKKNDANAIFTVNPMALAVATRRRSNIWLSHFKEDHEMNRVSLYLFNYLICICLSQG